MSSFELLKRRDIINYVPECKCADVSNKATECSDCSPQHIQSKPHCNSPCLSVEFDDEKEPILTRNVNIYNHLIDLDLDDIGPGLVLTRNINYLIPKNNPDHDTYTNNKNGDELIKSKSAPEPLNRINLWKPTLSEILKDPLLWYGLEQFMKKSYNQENLQFLIFAKGLNKKTNDEIDTAVNRLYDLYIKPFAPQ
eukprot:157369_1